MVLRQVEPTKRGRLEGRAGDDCFATAKAVSGASSRTSACRPTRAPHWPRGARLLSALSGSPGGCASLLLAARKQDVRLARLGGCAAPGSRGPADAETLAIRHEPVASQRRRALLLLAPSARPATMPGYARISGRVAESNRGVCVDGPRCLSALLCGVSRSLLGGTALEHLRSLRS